MPYRIIQLQGSLLLERYQYRHSSIVPPGSGCKQSPFAIVPYRYLSTGTQSALCFFHPGERLEWDGISPAGVKKAVDAFSEFGVVGLISFYSPGGCHPYRF